MRVGTRQSTTLYPCFNWGSTQLPEGWEGLGVWGQPMLPYSDP